MINHLKPLWFCLTLACSPFVTADWQNKIAPKITGTDLQQQTKISLKDYAGKTILLDFWASWCAPCRQSLPELNRLQKELIEHDFVVIAVNLDENIEDARRFLRQFPVQYPILIRVASSQIEPYQIEGLPVSYLIDNKGKVVTRFLGFKKRHLKQIKKYVLQNP